jgi:hypothetical protein
LFSLFVAAMQKFTPLGTSDFKGIIEENRYYVDKTLLIKHILEGNSITLLCRPRRFGKTLNMETLRCFFTNDADNRHLFEGLNISKDPASMEHLGKYSVIFLPLKEIKNANWSDAYRLFRNVLLRVWDTYYKAFKGTHLDESYKAGALLLSNENTHPVDCALMLRKLSDLLAELYHTKVVILIDEYDTPVHASWVNGYYNEMIGFLKELFGAAMKEGVLTGILRVSKESMFSDLNNFIASTVLDSDVFSEFFGFKEEEVLELFQHYDMNGRELSILHEWYDGYRFGRHSIYNPWSILRYVFSLEHTPEAYWVNTSDDRLLQTLFLGKDANIREYIEPLLRGEKIAVQLDKNLVFQDLKTDRNAVWTMLVLSGYLKAENARADEWYDVSIPNFEVRRAFTKSIYRWLQNEVLADSRSRMLEGLAKGQVNVFEEYLSEFVERVFSYHDTNKHSAENFYHAFLLGLFADVEHRYRILSNREAGLGRYDICMIPLDKQDRGVVIEIKSVKARGETIEHALTAAAAQIAQNKYGTALAEAGIQEVLLLALAVKNKTVRVRQITAPPPAA